MNKEDWGRAGAGLVSDRWPKDEEGSAEIPCLRDYPGDGAFGHIIMGASGTGVDIYVPKSMLEVAQKLIEGVEEGADNDEEL